MSQVTSAHGNADGSGLPQVPSIPLADDRALAAVGDQSIGTLVKDATTHLSTLVRAEVELAKSEVTREIKKGVKGSVFFIVALVVLLYSSFFLFFALAEMLADFGLLRSVAFGAVFIAMLLFATLFALLGWRKVRTIRAPERTINSVKDTAAALTQRGERKP
ncbi:phage holin family protein [Actinokineospora iranica]|uniref:Putative Holin-X, holin superfamily III n=1 Tax=Actinokineospora iranica TaxID=1271860 RepID=A0A1G6Y3E0_9PSEU|nr:phage holin family protein [Actinokineospora iranica]SDD84909.1 Putative Holin-X, holin superfamily III [Actinokineospora iranica]